MKKQNGITLIALVITIIVMLILVGVSVTVALNGGLFSTAQKAKQETATKRNEELNLSDGKVEINGEWYNSIDEYVNGDGAGEETLAPGLYAEDGTMTYTWEELLNTQIEFVDVLENVRQTTILSVDDNGVLNVPEFYGENPSNDYLVGKLVIDDSVTEIGFFNWCHNLTEIIIPNSITSLPDGAFRDCDGLKSVKIPDSITEIPEETFWHCEGFTSIAIPDGITTIGSGAFEQCRGLTSIYIPSSVTTINGAILGYTSSTVKIYCGATEAQSGWNTNWNYERESNTYLDVTYGVTRAEYEAIISE